MTWGQCAVGHFFGGGDIFSLCPKKSQENEDARELVLPPPLHHSLPPASWEKPRLVVWSNVHVEAWLSWNRWKGISALNSEWLPSFYHLAFSSPLQATQSRGRWQGRQRACTSTVSTSLCCALCITVSHTWLCPVDCWPSVAICL